jgi:hypothetical protein
VQRAAEAIRVAVNQADFIRSLAEFGMTARSSTPRELTDRTLISPAMEFSINFMVVLAGIKP